MKRFQRYRPSRARARGQSLTEFAITIPVVMLILLFGLDFGRVFLGWVSLNNVVREASNFAALNPTAWGANPNSSAQTEYARLVTADAAGINCTLPAIPPPTFPNGKGIGSPAVVQITCQFGLFTPLIGAIVGNPLSVSASSAFPIRSGAINGVPLTTITTTTSTSTTTTITTTSTTTTTTTSVAMCTVPDLVGDQTQTAPNTWSRAGFVSILQFDPLVSKQSNYKIGRQSLSAASSVPCTDGMLVQP